jgi:hypothetical protein
MKYVKILNNVTGSTTSTAVQVEGDYLLLLKGTSFTSVKLQASSTFTGTYVDLDDAEFTAETGKNISLPPCFLRAVYDTAVGTTLELLPFRRD